MVVCIGMMMRAVRRRLAASLWYVWAVVRMPLPQRVVVFAVHVPLHLELPVAVGPELWRQAVRHCRHCFSELVCVVAWLVVRNAPELYVCWNHAWFENELPLTWRLTVATGNCLTLIWSSQIFQKALEEEGSTEPAPAAQQPDQVSSFLSFL